MLDNQRIIDYTYLRKYGKKVNPIKERSSLNGVKQYILTQGINYDFIISSFGHIVTVFQSRFLSVVETTPAESLNQNGQICSKI